MTIFLFNTAQRVIQVSWVFSFLGNGKQKLSKDLSKAKAQPINGGFFKQFSKGNLLFKGFL